MLSFLKCDISGKPYSTEYMLYGAEGLSQVEDSYQNMSNALRIMATKSDRIGIYYHMCIQMRVVLQIQSGGNRNRIIRLMVYVKKIWKIGFCFRISNSGKKWFLYLLF